MTTDGNGTESMDLGKGRPRSSAISQQLQPQSEELEVWIVIQLTELSLNYVGIKLTELQMTQFSKTLCVATQSELSRAFRRAPIEFPQYFPNAGELLNLANRADGATAEGWKGFSREQVAQADRDFASGENAEWWAQMKAIAAKARIERREEVKENCRIPIRELTDIEVEEQWHRHEQKKAFIMQKYSAPEVS